MRNLTQNELDVVSGAGGWDCGSGGSDCGSGGWNSGCDDGKKNHGNNGFGNGGCDGVPGNSGKEDWNR